MTMGARYQIIGINDEQTTCDICGRNDLTKTVVLEDLTEANRGAIVRAGTACAARAVAPAGTRVKRAAFDRELLAVQAEIKAIRFSYEQATDVLADPVRLQQNWKVRRNIPGGGDATLIDERHFWEARREAALAELTRRGVAA